MVHISRPGPAELDTDVLPPVGGPQAESWQHWHTYDKQEFECTALPFMSMEHRHVASDLETAVQRAGNQVTPKQVLSKVA